MGRLIEGVLDITAELKLQWQIQQFGLDLHITISGGREHIGSVSIVSPESENNWRRPGHKEYVITEDIRKRLVLLLPNRVIVVTAGIHFDDMLKKDIEKVISLTGQWADTIPQILKRENWND